MTEAHKDSCHAMRFWVTCSFVMWVIWIKIKIIMVYLTGILPVNLQLNY